MALGPAASWGGGCGGCESPACLRWAQYLTCCAAAATFGHPPAEGPGTYARERNPGRGSATGAVAERYCICVVAGATAGNRSGWQQKIEEKQRQQHEEINGSNKSTRADSGNCAQTQVRSASSTCAAEPEHAGGNARLGHALGGRGEARVGDVRCLVASARAIRSLHSQCEAAGLNKK